MKAADDLNEAIEFVERQLELLQLNASAEVPLDDGWFLGFGKIDRDWRLYAYRAGSEQQVALTSASLKVRVQAIDQLPALHEALLNASAAQLEKVQQATAAAFRFVEYLRSQPGLTPTGKQPMP